jgi:hypothetical protein
MNKFKAINQSEMRVLWMKRLVRRDSRRCHVSDITEIPKFSLLFAYHFIFTLQIDLG